MMGRWRIDLRAAPARSSHGGSTSFSDPPSTIQLERFPRCGSSMASRSGLLPSFTPCLTPLPPRLHQRSLVVGNGRPCTARWLASTRFACRALAGTIGCSASSNVMDPTSGARASSVSMASRRIAARQPPSVTIGASGGSATSSGGDGPCLSSSATWDQFEIERVGQRDEGGQRRVRVVHREDSANGLGFHVGSASEFGLGEIKANSPSVECPHDAVGLIDPIARALVRASVFGLGKAFAEMSFGGGARCGHRFRLPVTYVLRSGNSGGDGRAVPVGGVWSAERAGPRAGASARQGASAGARRFRRFSTMNRPRRTSLSPS